MNSLIFALGKLIGALLLPPVIFLITGLIGLRLQDLKPRLGKLLIVSSIVAIGLLSLPVVSNWLVNRVEIQCHKAEPGLADAIVILGGGIRRVAPEYGGGPTVRSLALERLRYGAQLYRQTTAPILVTGGAPEGDQAEAPIMSEILQQEFSVPVRWVEDRSLTTRENADNAGKMLKSEGIRRIYLVSQGWHLARAVQEFERNGFEVIPAGTGCPVSQKLEWVDLLPDPQSLLMSYYACHEALGMAWYRLIELVSPERQ